MTLRFAPSLSVLWAGLPPGRPPPRLIQQSGGLPSMPSGPPATVNTGLFLVDQRSSNSVRDPSLAVIVESTGINAGFPS